MLEKEGTGLVQVCEDVSPFIQEVSLVLKDFSSSYDYHDLDDWEPRRTSSYLHFTQACFLE